MRLPITVPSRNVRKSPFSVPVPWLFEKHERNWKLCLATSAFWMILMWLLIHYKFLPWVETRHQQEDYILVIDAGSTGTRLFGFSYFSQTPNFHLKPIPPETAVEYIPYRPGIRAYNRIETLPGLQTLTLRNFENHDDTNSTELIQVIRNKGLDPLLKWAKAVIPASVREKTPICLFASAGMREMDKLQSNALVYVIHSILANSGFKYNSRCVEVISGTEEGLFGWVSLNHYLGTFNFSISKRSKSPKSPLTVKETLHEENSPTMSNELVKDKHNFKHVHSARQESPRKWIGAMDLGGSSLEITFPTNDELVKKLNIQGTEYRVESRTFEHLGLNKAFETSLMLVSGNKSQKNPPLFSHPCLQRGFQLNETIEVQRKKFVLVGVEGDTSWEHCMNLVNKVIYKSLTCEADRCLSKDFNAHDHRLIGMNGLYVVWSFYNLTTEAPLAQLEEKGKEFCSRDWKEVYAELKDVVLLHTYCFRAAYVLALSKSLLRMDVEQDRLEVAPQSISWPLGAALLQVSNPQHHKRSMKFRDFWKWLFCVFSFGFLGYVCLKSILVRSSREKDRVLISEYGENCSTSHARFRAAQKSKRRNGSYKRLNNLDAVFKRGDM
eukprot:g3257.t1